MSTERTRTRGYPAVNAFTSNYVKNYYNDSFFTTNYQHASTVGFSNETVTDYVTKDFREKVKAGAIINNPFFYSKTEISSGLGTYRLQSFDTAANKSVLKSTQQRTGHITEWLIEALNVSFQHSTLSTISDIPDVKLKALSRVDSSDYSFGEDTLEIRETIALLKNGMRLLKNPLKEVRSIARKIQRQSDRNRRVLNMNQYDALNSAYLQYRFALTPTVRSVMDIVDVMGGKVKGYKPRFFARAGKTSSDSSTSDVTYGDFSFSQTKKIETLTRATIMYELKSSDHGIRFQLGLRNKDIIPTLWAVVPLSFMVDRMFDISSALKGLSTLSDMRIDLLACSTSVKTVATTETQVVAAKTTLYPDGKPQYTREISGNKTISQNVSYRRKPWAPNPFDLVPQLHVGSLVEDLTGAADVFAIAYSILSGPSK